MSLTSKAVRGEDLPSFTVRVWIDGKLLRPDCVGCTAAAALAYVTDALVDARPNDHLSLRAQGDGNPQTWQTSEALDAARWLTEQLQGMSSSTSSEGVTSGTRPVVADDRSPTEHDDDQRRAG